MTLKPWSDTRRMPSLNGVALAFHGGSRVMCSPPPADTDDDYVVLVHPETWRNVLAELQREDWKLGGSDFYHNCDGDSYFKSYTKDDMNLILTMNAEWYQKMLLATKTCMALNEPDKQRRIVIFQAIVYGAAP